MARTRGRPLRWRRAAAVSGVRHERPRRGRFRHAFGPARWPGLRRGGAGGGPLAFRAARRGGGAGPDDRRCPVRRQDRPGAPGHEWHSDRGAPRAVRPARRVALPRAARAGAVGRRLVGRRGSARRARRGADRLADDRLVPRGVLRRPVVEPSPAVAVRAARAVRHFRPEPGRRGGAGRHGAPGDHVGPRVEADRGDRSETGPAGFRRAGWRGRPVEPRHRVRVLIDAGLLLFATALLFAAPPAAAAVPAEVREALRRLFPKPVRIEERTLLIDDSTAAAIAERGGGEPPSRIATCFVAHAGAEKTTPPLGYACLDTHVVRTLPETLLIAFDRDVTLLRIDVLTFDEPADYRPRRAFLDQFEGRGREERLDLRRNIRAISGATLSSRAVTEASNRVRVLIERLLLGGEGR
ncbi:MAG: FMN-binding protein [Acidobacteria bacterium]|nr:MAG: FMN-binding protein [Acidobacteriota bacterium]